MGILTTTFGAHCAITRRAVRGRAFEKN
jgi:hypothetical protein